MAATRSLNKPTYLTNLQAESNFLKGFLHLTSTEMTEVSSPLAAGALRIICGDFLESIRVGFELIQKLADILLSLLLGSCDRLVSV